MNPIIKKLRAMLAYIASTPFYRFFRRLSRRRPAPWEKAKAARDAAFAKQTDDSVEAPNIRGASLDSQIDDSMKGISIRDSPPPEPADSHPNYTEDVTLLCQADPVYAFTATTTTTTTTTIKQLPNHYHTFHKEYVLQRVDYVLILPPTIIITPCEDNDPEWVESNYPYEPPIRGLLSRNWGARRHETSWQYTAFWERQERLSRSQQKRLDQKYGVGMRVAKQAGEFKTSKGDDCYWTDDDDEDSDDEDEDEDDEDEEE
ncbi:hypothetical protein BZA05DRAFT_441605 [Tricharina praecox]|uniref:uncharacterized protein n=1 Tax=Tricharina praecox TaxID=43433 RepID=UPI002221020D|nr:uncharacterized protein BZA05DRAFT_441605 [Tricharina praecox]KAI5856969.1 hypothetical protein BZA05DRAFT_441605 [Tricharina praecox]